jgi:hypothetical protein
VYCADYSFLKHEHALQAAAVVAASRSICNISPWPDELATRLGYSLHEISDCLESILSIAKLNTSTVNPHHGACEASSSQRSQAGSGSGNGQEDHCDRRAGEAYPVPASAVMEGEVGKSDAKEDGSPRCATAFAGTW